MAPESLLEFACSVLESLLELACVSTVHMLRGLKGVIIGTVISIDPILAIGAGMALHVGRLGRRLGGDACAPPNRSLEPGTFMQVDPTCVHVLYSSGLSKGAIFWGLL